MSSINDSESAYHDPAEAEKAIADHEKSLAEFRHSGDRQGEGKMLYALGSARLFLGMPRRIIEQPFVNWHATGDWEQLTKASGYYQQALTIFRELGNQKDEGYALYKLGEAHRFQDDSSQADALHQQALVIFQKTGDRDGEAYTLYQLGKTKSYERSKQELAEFFERALAIFRELGNLEAQGYVHYYLGQLRLYEGRGNEGNMGFAHLEKALKISRQIANQHLLGNAAFRLGMAYDEANVDEGVKALEYYQQALEACRQIGDKHGEMYILYRQARDYSISGDEKTAQELWEKIHLLEQETGFSLELGASAPPPPPPTSEPEPPAGAFPNILEKLLKRVSGESTPRQPRRTSERKPAATGRRGFEIFGKINKWLGGEPSQPAHEESASRVLNANFADPADVEKTLPLDRSLGSGREYDLRVEIGPHWDKNPSLFPNDRMAAFPDEEVKKRLLTEEDREHGKFDVKVVFASNEFTPNLITAMISVPVNPSSCSIPYVNGKLAEKAGWVCLRVRTPQLDDLDSSATTTAHGRLCLYYRNNLLQSGAIQVHVTREAGIELENSNSGEIDFVLTGGFQQIEDIFDSPINIEEGVDQQVSVNLTLNEDGSNGHRIVVVSQLDPNTPVEMPAAWMPYNLKEAKDLLNEARQTLIEIIKPLKDKPSKDRESFVEDLKKLAILGSRARNKFLESGLTIEEKKNGSHENDDEPGMTGAQWTNILFDKLESASVIQVARTGPASYVFPWALLYDYPMERSEPRICNVIFDDWGENGQRDKKKPAGRFCRYKDEEWHKSDVVCPYGFWGLKHVIEQPASGLRKRDDQWRLSASGKVLTSGGMPLTIIATADVDQDKFKTHKDNLGKLKGIRFEPKDPAYDRTMAKKVLRAPQIVYFLCHGEWEPKDPAEREKAIPYLSIGKHDDDMEHKIFPTTLINWIITRSLDANEWATHRPLVMINGCETANINPEKEANFVTAFDYLGASGVIGTEISMLVDSAYTVAEEIIRHLSEGGQIGRAVREMRWMLLNEGNVIGLAYTPYCRAILHIESEV